MTEGVVKLIYEPRKQFLPFHQRTKRFACMVAHRRAGKTVASVNEIIHRAIYCKKKRPRYAYIAPLLKQGKKIAWEYLKEYTAGLEKKKPSESELTVVLRHNEAELTIYGADNPDGFRGQYFDGIVLDEYGDMSPSIWTKVLLPTLADRRGWAVFIGTFKGKNHFYKVFRRSQGLDLPEGEDKEEWIKRWFNFLLKASESGILSEEDLKVQRAEQDEDEYQQEYECNPNAVMKGTYYAKLITQLEAKGQIYSAAAEWDPDQPVDVAFDLGYSDSTAAWFYQKRLDGIAIIDYLEAHGQYLSYYFDQLRKERRYKYGTIWLPHDARAKTLATRRSVVEQFLDEEFPVRIAPKLDINDGIAAVRKVLPMCHFNTKTENGVEALRAYRRLYNEEKRVFSDDPDHDWASHGSDAFRYLSLVAQGIFFKEDSEKPRIVIPTPKMQLEVLFQERERRLQRTRGRV